MTKNEDQDARTATQEALDQESFRKNPRCIGQRKQCQQRRRRPNHFLDMETAETSSKHSITPLLS